MPLRTLSLRSWVVLGLAAAMAALAIGAATAHASSGVFGVESVAVQAREENGEAATRAGSHPYLLSTTIFFNHHEPTERQKQGGDSGAGIPDGDVKDLEAVLPPGVIVDLLGGERCSQTQFAKEECPPASQVGMIVLHTGLYAINGPTTDGEDPVYNVTPSSANVPGQLGFSIKGFYVIIPLIGKVHTGGDYGVAAEISNASQLAAVDGATLELWGDPSAASHNAQRIHIVCQGNGSCQKIGGAEVPPSNRPFLTLPTSCTVQPGALVSADSWQEPGVWTPFFESAPLPAMRGCEGLSFTPSLEVKPETAVADTPTGVGVTLKIPQLETLSSRSEAVMKEAVVTLPSGLTVSPSAVGGLGACSEAQIALASAAAPSCPESSKIASVEAVTPLLENKLAGSVYLAQQGNAGAAQGANPFGSLIALYLVVEGSGVLVKAPGEVSLNQSTGQLTARFGEDPATGFYLPELPYSELKLNFFGGPRAPLVTAVCGSYTTTSLLTPYSAPESGPPATPQSDFDVDAGCATGAFNPSLSAGTTSNQAGGYSPFVATFSREDSEQELGAIQVHMPPGLLGMLSNVPLCSEPQAAQGTCGPETQIGEVSAAVGPGPDPYYVTGGRAYLTGPTLLEGPNQSGAPFGLTFVVPARGGPFDLGDVVVRAAISVNPVTAAVTVTSAPLPTILQGVPLQVRSVTVNINRPDFIFNPSSCEKMSIGASMQGSLGATPIESAPFQAGDCAELTFKPKFSVSTSGKTSKVDGASLDAKVIYPPGPRGTQANFRSVKVDLPKQLPARLTTLQKACLASVFETNPAACPAASVIGIVRVSTPVLPGTLTGPVYFVSHGGEAFPSLVIVLQGDGVRVDLTAATFISKKGITSSTFKSLPDVPVSTFELYLPEGPYSALAANGNLCTSKLTMPTAFVAQNGAVIHQSTPISVTDCAKAKKQGKRAMQVKQARRVGRARRTSRARAAAAAPKPVVSTGPVSGVTQTAATLTGAVNPEGYTTSWAFEIGTGEAYGTDVFGRIASEGDEPQEVTFTLEDLAPLTTYCYRLSATSANGTSLPSQPVCFTTAGTAYSLTVPPAPPLLPIPDIAFPSETGTVITTTTKTSTRAQKRARALKTCKRRYKRKARRALCDQAARKKYG